MSIRYVLPACAAALAFASPAAAQQAAPTAVVVPQPAGDPWAAQRASFERARSAWLGECRRRYVTQYAPRRGPGVAGLLLGGVFGGLAGRAIAGDGDRALGTAAGAVVGAVAGSAIEGSARNRRRDTALFDEAAEYCASYFDYQTQGALQPGYAPAYAYAQPVMMVAVPAPMAQPAPEPKCTEEVTYEYVDVPVRQRSIPPRAKRQRDKRLPMD